MDMLEAERAYQTQAMFAHIVDTLVMALMTGHVSVYELRDACTLALNKYAVHRPPEPILIETQMTMDEVNERIARGAPLSGKIVEKKAKKEGEINERTI